MTEDDDRDSVIGDLIEVALILMFLPLFLMGWAVHAAWRLLVRRDI